MSTTLGWISHDFLSSNKTAVQTALEQCRGQGCQRPCTVENPSIAFGYPKITSYCGPEALQIT